MCYLCLTGSYLLDVKNMVDNKKLNGVCDVNEYEFTFEKGIQVQINLKRFSQFIFNSDDDKLTQHSYIHGIEKVKDIKITSKTNTIKGVKSRKITISVEGKEIELTFFE